MRNRTANRTANQVLFVAVKCLKLFITHLMAENKLTDKHLRSLKPGAVEQIIGDGGGLWIRVMPSEKGGAINLYYRFQFNGKERRYNCGTYPDISLSHARENRNAARLLVKRGIDPVEKEASERVSRASAQAQAKLDKTVADLLHDWERIYLSSHRKGNGKDVVQSLNLDVIPLIGSMKAKDVRLAHVIDVVDKIVDRDAKRKANMVFSLMRQMFRFGMARGIVETDPTFGLSKKQVGGKEIPSTRNLSYEEIVELNEKLAFSGMHEKMRSGIWLLLATGARVGELLKAKWADIDTTNKTWTIPVENAKNAREHLIHLSNFALQQINILENIRSGQYLFEGRKTDSSLSDKALSKAIRDRIRSVPLKNRTNKTGKLLLTGGEWSPHDLRRTMASRMGDLGVAPHVIERCLNHVQQGIVGVYQRQEYLKERRGAFDKWGAKLASLTSPKRNVKKVRGK